MICDANDVVQAIRNTLPENSGPLGLHEPLFRGNEWEYVKECLDTAWVSSVGKFVDRFEEMLAGYAGVRRAVAVVNGTSALHICLKLAGVEPGDEVIVPALTFVATANAVSYCGATPHFADSEERTLGLDPFKLGEYLGGTAETTARGCVNKKTGRRIRAVVPVHTFGHPVDMDPLIEISRRFGIEVIEDAAESLGSFYKGRHTGNFGSLAALSFNGNKIITTGGGGAILTNDDELGRLAKHITTTAKVPHRWSYAHDMVGYNYRLPNFNAALGCAQLEQLPEFLRSKRALAARYSSAFEGVRGIRFFSECGFASSNYWLNTLILDKDQDGKLDEILDLTNRAGMMTRPAWTLMHRLPMFAGCPRMDLSTSESLEKRIINIPSSSVLGETSAKA